MPVAQPVTLATISDKLSAVNAMLASIGEAPVNTLEQSQSADVAIALGALHEIMLQCQTKGWSWNREFRFPIGPDDDGIIHLPDNTIRVDTAYASESSSTYAVTQRGAKLYNLADHTFAFPGSVDLDIIFLLEWDDMPAAAKRYITIRACQLFQGRIQGSQLVWRATEDDVTASLATLEQAEDEVADNNSVYGNATVLGALYGRGVRRNRGNV
jgi:hypothetical protein